MHISPYYRGLGTLENMMYPSAFFYSLYGNLTGWHLNGLPSTMADIYFCLGFGLHSIPDVVNLHISRSFRNVSDFNFESSNFDNLRNFLDNGSLADIQKQPLFKIFTSKNEEEYYNYFQKINNEYRHLVTLVESKANFSFNRLVNYWENVIAPSTKSDIGYALNTLRSISDKYCTKTEQSMFWDIKNEANDFSLHDLFFNKQDTNQSDIDEFKTLVNKLIVCANPRTSVDFFDTTTFKNDIPLIQSTLSTLVFNHPDIFNACNLNDIKAIQFLNDPYHVDEGIYNNDIIAQYFPVKGPYYSITFFIDHSILVQRTESSHFEMFYDFNIIPQLVDNAFTAYLKYKNRKTPTISKYFVANYQNFMENNINNNILDSQLFNSLFHIIKTYSEYSDVLKLGQFNILEIFSVNHEKLFENTLDQMHSIVKQHAIDKYSKAIFSNKYMHLYSDKLLAVFNELYNQKVPCSCIQDNIGRKMASFKTQEDLYDALESFLNLLDNFSFEMVQSKAHELKAEIISNSDNKLLIRIKTFEESKALGSSSWCISRDDYFFKQYTEKYNEQYFLYNFNKTSRDNECLIGCTLTSKSKLTISHLKNDVRIKEHEQIDYIIKKVKESKLKPMSGVSFTGKIRNLLNSIKVFA